MKVRHYLEILCAAFLAFLGCEGNVNALNIELLTESDSLAIRTSIETMIHSNAVDSVLSQTNIGYVGKYSDPNLGYYESSFLAELNSANDFSLPEAYKETEWDNDGNPTKATGIIAGDSVVSVQLVVHYNHWFGDSLNACRMSIYELDKALDRRPYNINPEEYYNKFDSGSLLGRKAYSAYDASIPDSLRIVSGTCGCSPYSPHISFPLDKKTFGENRILKAYREHPEYFKDDALTEQIFKGIYVKTDYGEGTILYVNKIDLEMQFCYHYIDEATGLALKKQNGADSLFYDTQTILTSNRKFIQTDQFLSSDLLQGKMAWRKSK